MKTHATRAAVVAAFFLLRVAGGADFALHDGDVVAFLGDSITAARGYTKIVEHYTLMRFPDRKVRFVNAGKGGDTAQSALKRLDSDVFSKGATVMLIALGVNDIGWGMKATAENKQRYLDGLRAMIEQCSARKIRPIVCSPAITAEPPDKAEHGFLQAMADEAFALAQSLGAQTVDVQHIMRDVQRRILAANAQESDEKKWVRLHAPDGVHLTDLGQLAMAYAILKGLEAPANVSSATIDATKAALVDAASCRITEIVASKDQVSFIRLDGGLPMTLGAFSAFDFRWVPLPDAINRYLLSITNLAPGDYQIEAEGRLLGKVTAAQLERGLNISTITDNAWEPGGPWDAQSVAVKELVDARDKLWISEKTDALYLSKHPHSAELAAQANVIEEKLVGLQRALAKPYPYHFLIRRLVK